MSAVRKKVEMELEKQLSEVGKTVQEFPWHDADAYAAWLAQTYHFVRHSTNLLALKVARCVPEKPERHRAALEHLRDESGHDKMLLRDLKTLGRDISEFPMMVEIGPFFQSQYYWLDHQGPVSFTGYTLMLEGLAARKGSFIADSAVKAHGKAASSFILLHSKADIEHEQLQLSESNDATEQEVEAVIQNLRQCAFLYNAMLKNIIAQVKQSAKPKLKIAA